MKNKISTVDLEGRPESGLRRKLYIVIFEADTFAGKVFDIALLFLIFISIMQVLFESDLDIKNKYETWFYISEWTLTAFFSLEYLLRLYVSKKPFAYARSFFGVVDLLAILPAYLSVLFPASYYFSIVRVLRLFRVFRILKLARFVKASNTLGNALIASRYKISIFFGAVTALVLILGACMHIVEGHQPGFSSIPKSMYWTVVTMTTVGYGDVVPVTTLGKFVASLMMLIGYAIIAVPTGIVSSELVEEEKKIKSHFKKTCIRCQESLLQEANYCHKCGERQI